MFADPKVVPVLMYHSIGMQPKSWAWAHLTEDLEVFEKTLEILANRGYRTISLEELYAYMKSGTSIPHKSIVLTFDDGYLDNWVLVAPLLRKFNFRATVYVTPDFIEESARIRSANEGEADYRDNPVGFMNWAELREADREGVLDVQSHAMTHTWYFSGPEIVDYHRPSEPFQYPWMAWNAEPARKPYYLNEDQQRLVQWGTPIFRHDKALVVRRFLPDSGLVQDVCNYVADNGRDSFFADPNWRTELERRFPDLTDSSCIPGYYETEEEYRARVRDELLSSKEIIEGRLNKKVEFFAWPGGGVNEVAAEIAREVGYKSWTLSSWQEPSKRNAPFADPEGVKRITGSSSVYAGERHLGCGGAEWIYHRIRSHQGSVASKISGAVSKLAKIVQRSLQTGDRQRHE